MVQRVGATRIYTTSEVAEAKRYELETQYLDGEIDEETYFERAPESIPDTEVERGMKTMKSNRYESVKEQFIEGEVSDEELEEEMDRLLKRGVDFTDEYDISPDVASEPMLPFKDIVRLGAFITIFGFFSFIIMADGAAVFPLAAFAVLLFVYALL